MRMQDPVRYRRLLDLLGQALDLPAAARTPWVEGLSGEPAEFQPDLLRLLAHQDDSQMAAQVDAGAGSVAAGLAESADSPFVAGQMIGRYRLERPLGEGGMGVVWLARKDGDNTLPPVAIKVPTAIANHKAAAERLTREGAILAALNHPNIARLIEAGVTADGTPFLALEFIDGQRLADYCDAKQLTLDARLTLFVNVLDAVAYAHSTLVLHRDLKPGNVLVTTGGAVKLLDFGIAKLLDDTGSAGSTKLTQMVGRALTPDYASPEQIAGIPLTVASDVYSLGVMLFELVTGERPYKLKRGSAAELEEAILTADTGRPSTVANAEFAARNRETVGRLRRKLAGDLDTIILKALKKKPAERYGSVLALKEDIERYLSGRPVLATPDSAAYRFRRFVVRNRLVVGATAAIFVALLAGLAAALWQTAEAREQARVAATERARAEQRFDDVRAISNSLIFDIYDAIELVPGATDARALLTRKAVEFLDKVAADRRDDAVLARELATGYRKIAEAMNYAMAANLGDAVGANRNHEKALALLEPLGSRPNADKADVIALAKTAMSYGTSLLEQGEVARALPYTRKGLALRKALLEADPNNADRRRDMAVAESHMANALVEMGDLRGALALNDSMAARYRALVAEDPKSAKNRWGNICGYANTGSVLIALGEYAKARERMQRALDLNAELLADRPDHYSVMNAFGEFNLVLGELAHRAGDRGAAQRFFAQALSHRKLLAARDAKDVEVARNLQKARASLGLVLVGKGRAAEGTKLLQEAKSGLTGMIAARPSSRSLLTARVEVLVLSAKAQRAMRDSAGACNTFSEAGALLKWLREKYPALHSLRALTVDTCTGTV